MADKELKITLVKSLIGSTDKQKKIAKSLGLTKTDKTVTHADTPVIRGMINKLSHLLTVE